MTQELKNNELGNILPDNAEKSLDLNTQSKEIDWDSIKERLLKKLWNKYNLSIKNLDESNLKIHDLARSVLLFENRDISTLNFEGKKVWYCPEKQINELNTDSFDVKNKMIENINTIHSFLEVYDKKNLSIILRDRWLKRDGLGVYNDIGKYDCGAFENIEFEEKDFDSSLDFITGDVELDSYLYLIDIYERLRQMNVIDEKFKFDIQKLLQLLHDLVLFVLVVIKEFDTIENEIRAKNNGTVQSMYVLLDVEEYELIMNKK